MDIVVIVKRIDSSDNSPTGKVMDIGDKTAIDFAISLREKYGLGNTRVSVICIAPYEASDVIRECYGLGVDAGYLLSDPMFEQIDVEGIVNILFSALTKLNGCDLVLMASPSNDTITVDLGNKLARLLGFKHLKQVEHLDGYGNRVVVRGKNISDREIVELPALINLSCDSEQKVFNAMRIMKAFKKEVKVFTSRDLNMDAKKNMSEVKKRIAR